MKVKLSLILSALLLTSNLVSRAQDYDDIYYNPSKETKKVEKKNDKYIEDNDVFNSYDVIYNIGDMRDVDEYNRRYTYIDTLATDSMPLGAQGDFVYTDRIRRFYNPSVVTESNTPEINIIIGTPTTYYNPFMYDWNMPLTWNYGWYNPWIYSNWHYDWCWGYGWDWYYPMYHHHHHHHYPHGWYPGYVHHPVIGGGSIVSGGGNNRPTYNAGGRRPFGVNTTNEGVGRRPSSTSGRGNSSVKSDNRKSSSRRNSSSSNSGGRRPSMSSNNDYRNSSSSSYNNSVRSSRSSNDNYDRGSSSSFGGGGSNRGGGSRGGRR